VAAVVVVGDTAEAAVLAVAVLAVAMALKQIFTHRAAAVWERAGVPVLLVGMDI
jgi:hypothetical protein